jgi:anhydro-N-acetylmuramic acid kinase
MRVAGIMSGTSADGIDVAIVEVTEREAVLRTRLGKKQSRPVLLQDNSGAMLAEGASKDPRIKPVAFHSVPYPKPVREAILAVSNSMTHTATISRLSFLLGELYASAVHETCRRCSVALDSISLLGMHGQTIFHESEPVEYLGRRVASTLQIGEAAVVAERTGLWVISNFRERDIAAGGKGAPLVPLVDYLLFRDRRAGRVALNIGGIANITVIPAAAERGDVVAFDTGPGNMVIDALVTRMTDGRQHYDRDGRIARKGKIHARLLDSMLSDPYFAFDPPKTAGREQFGRDFVNGLIGTGVPLPDLIATAAELTARSIARSITGAISEEDHIREVIVSGGGVHNRQIMKRLGELLPDFTVNSSEAHGIDPDAKEAIAFAVLAYEFIQGRPGNLPSATGARHPAILGKSSPVC